MKKLLILLVTLCLLNFCYGQNFDIDLLRDINHNRNQNCDPAMKALSNSTAGVLIAVPAAIFTYSLIKKDSLNFRKSFVVGASVVTAASATYILKEVVNRQRPYNKYSDIDALGSESSASFPSMHASTSFSLATSLSLEYPKWYVIVPSYLWASSVSYSRMHMGVHYPSDVLAGALVGAGSAFLCHKINKLLGNKKLAQKIFWVN